MPHNFYSNVISHVRRELLACAKDDYVPLSRLLEVLRRHLEHADEAKLREAAFDTFVPLLEDGLIEVIPTGMAAAPNDPVAIIRIITEKWNETSEVRLWDVCMFHATDRGIASL